MGEIWAERDPTKPGTEYTRTDYYGAPFRIPRRVRLWRRLWYGRRCTVCWVPSWMNPPRDHEAWTGHAWARKDG